MLSKVELAVPVEDVKELRLLLQSLVTYFQADQIKRGALAMQEVRPSPLQVNVERYLERLGNLLSEHLLQIEDEGDDVSLEVPETEEEWEATSPLITGPDTSKAKKWSPEDTLEVMKSDQHGS